MEITLREKGGFHVFRKMLGLVCILAAFPVAARAADDAASVVVSGLRNPGGVTVADDGRIFVTTGGNEGGRDGVVYVFQNGKVKPFAIGLVDPKGIAAHRDSLYIADGTRVWKVSATGRATVLAGAKDFPSPPHNLSAVAVEWDKGTLYVGDQGDADGKGAAIYRITSEGSVETVLDGTGRSDFGCPSGLLLDGAAFLLVADSKRQMISRVKLADGTIEEIRSGLPGVNGLVWDAYGHLFISEGGDKGSASVIPRPGKPPVLLPGSEPARGIGVDRAGGAAYRRLTPSRRSS